MTSIALTFRATLLFLLPALSLPVALSSCGGDDAKAPQSNADAGSGGAGGAGSDGGFPPAPPSDPCLTAGLHFDGKADCDVVRCPKLQCECAVTGSDGTPLSPETVTLNACVPGEGCLDRVDCTRLCDPARRLTRSACEERLSSVRGGACEDDADCLVGRCRQESIGNVCADALPCASDGHCGAGFLCRLNPGSVDSESGLPTSLGSCSDGKHGSVCYEDAHCKYGGCAGNRCPGGRENDSCKSDANCESGFCRIYAASSTSTGICVSGEAGGSCEDDGDCGTGLHCTSGACHGSGVGQSCDDASDCASGICVSGSCRGGEPGSVCVDDADCDEGLCALGRCSSGSLLAPCADASDCETGLRCARQVCTDGSTGSPCSSGTDCAVRACVRGSCSAGENGDVCDAPEHCASGRCADPAGVEPGVCTSGAKGAPCRSPSNCVSGSCSAQLICN